MKLSQNVKAKCQQARDALMATKERQDLEKKREVSFILFSNYKKKKLKKRKNRSWELNHFLQKNKRNNTKSKRKKKWSNSWSLEQLECDVKIVNIVNYSTLSMSNNFIMLLYLK